MFEKASSKIIRQFHLQYGDELHKCDAHLQHCFKCKTNMITVELALKSKIILNVRNKKKYNKTTVGYKSDKYNMHVTTKRAHVTRYCNYFSQNVKSVFSETFPPTLRPGAGVVG